MARRRLATLIVLLAPALASAQPLKPPPDLAPLFDQVYDGPDRSAAVVALSARDDAAPYLRSAARRATERFHTRDLAEALWAIEARAYERNRKRAAAWAAGKRFDLMAEFLATCNNDDARPLAEQLLKVQDEIAREATALLKGPQPIAFLGAGQRLAAYRSLADRAVTIDSSTLSTLIRCEECKILMHNRTN